MTRKEFEALISALPHGKSVDRWPAADRRTSAWLAWPGQYRDYAVQLAWEVLQEAQRRERERG